MRTEFATQAGIALQNEDFRHLLWFLGLWLVHRADLDLSEGDAEAAAVLLGASFALDESGSELDWTMNGRRERVAEQLRTVLEPDEIDVAMSKGVGLSIEELHVLITAKSPVREA